MRGNRALTRGIGILAGGVVAASGCSATAGGDATTTTGPTASPTSATISPATSSATSSSTSTTPDLSARVTIGGSGDLLTHVAVRRSAEAYAGRPGRYDFRPMFAKVKGLISAPDISLCHLETPLTRRNTNLTKPGVLIFNTPHELADAVKSAGYDGCDFASNHTWDQGLSGLADTIGVFDKVGLGYAGPGASKANAETTATYEVGDVSVAHLGFTYTILNNWGPNTEVPPEAPWLANALWPKVRAKGIIAEAKKAKAGGADFVVVSLHWGQEYVSDPTAEQLALAKDLLASNAIDLLLGTHVHRVQPCEKINGKYVFYGMGNFLSNQSPDADPSLLPQTQEGVIVQVTLDRDAKGKVTSSAAIQPTKVNRKGHVIELATKTGNPTTYHRVTDMLTSLGDCRLTTLKPAR